MGKSVGRGTSARAFVAGVDTPAQKKRRRKGTKATKQDWSNAIASMRIEVGHLPWIEEGLAEKELLTVVAYVPKITPALNELIRMNHWHRAALVNAWRRIARYLKLAAHGWAVKHRQKITFPASGIHIKMDRYAPGVAPDPIDNLPAVWKPVLDGLVSARFSEHDGADMYVYHGVKCAPPGPRSGSRMVLYIGIPNDAISKPPIA